MRSVQKKAGNVVLPVPTGVDSNDCQIAEPRSNEYVHAAEDAAKQRALEVARAEGKAWPYPF